MFGKAITYKTKHKCLADNRTAKNEVSVGPAPFGPTNFKNSEICEITDFGTLLEIKNTNKNLRPMKMIIMQQKKPSGFNWFCNSEIISYQHFFIKSIRLVTSSCGC